MNFEDDKTEAGNSGTYIFNIADFNVKIIFTDTNTDNINLLPSFLPFRETTVKNEDILFKLTINNDITPCPAERIGTFDTGNGDTIVETLSDGGYQYVIKDISGNECCILQTDKYFSDCYCTLKGNFNMRQFGLNNALMLVFAFAGSLQNALLIHASLVRKDGKGYAFVAKSGTGKSTHAGLWLAHIPGCDLMNDDNPVIRIIDGVPYIYGSPWSGKTPCYRQVKARLGAITRIDRAKQNSIDKLGPTEAFASLLPCCSSMKWDKEIYNAICNSIIKLIETTGIYTLHCLPDKEAAILCHNEISK